MPLTCTQGRQIQIFGVLRHVHKSEVSEDFKIPFSRVYLLHNIQACSQKCIVFVNDC